MLKIVEQDRTPVQGSYGRREIGRCIAPAG
jgi:hypothetical protein